MYDDDKDEASHDDIDETTLGDNDEVIFIDHDIWINVFATSIAQIVMNTISSCKTEKRILTAGERISTAGEWFSMNQNGKLKKMIVIMITIEII